MTHETVLDAAGLGRPAITGGTLPVTTPIDGSEIALLKEHRAA